MSPQGFGIGLRRQYAEELVSFPQEEIDFLEITPENWLFFGGAREHTWQRLAEKWPMLSHSVSLSIGGLDPFDAPLLDALQRLHARTGAAFFSDHLCWSSAGGRPTHDLLPLPFNHEAAAHVIARIGELEQRTSRRFVVENPTYYARMPGSVWSEARFLTTILEESSCLLLLDVNNVYVNAKNHGHDPYAFIDAMPAHKIAQIHLAGHSHEGRVVIDTHIGPVIDEVWALYRYTLAHVGRPVPTLIEWDQDVPPLEVLMRELARARKESAAALQ